MSKTRVRDISPKFDRYKNYCFGVLQLNSTPDQVPERFSSSVKPLYFSGNELSLLKIKSCGEFLLSGNSPFRSGSVVHFYEVVYGDGVPLFSHIYTGTAGVIQKPQHSLSDGVKDDTSSSSPLLPVYNTLESEKLLFKTQSDQISYYQRCLQDERSEFSKERSVHLEKIQILNDKLVDQSIEINKLVAENEALRIRYEESNKYADRMVEFGRSSLEADAPQGLADKGVAMLDGMLGDGASQQIAMGIASGLGNGVSKLIEFGVDYFRNKSGLPSVPSQSVSSPSVSSQPSSLQSVADIDAERYEANKQIYKEELGQWHD